MTTSKVSKRDANSAVAEEFGVLRTRRRLSRDQVADAAGISASTYGRLERAERDITVEYLAAVARAFRIAPSEIVASAEAQHVDAFHVTTARRRPVRGPRSRASAPRVRGRDEAETPAR